MIVELEGWCRRHNLLNVHRELTLYERESGDCETMEGPVVLDFDNEQEDLDAACKCVGETLRFLQLSLGINLAADCRVFFTGRKGFHIEIRPHAVETDLLEPTGHFERTRLAKKIIEKLQRTFGTSPKYMNQLDKQGTMLDRDHTAKRINGSINAWNNGHICYRKVLLVTPETLLNEGPNSLVPRLMRQSEIAGAL